MKKIDTSNIVAGVRKLGLIKASFDHLQESYKDVFNDLLQGILAQVSGYTSLFGCVNSGGGSVYTLSAGAIYGSSQQEVFEIAAFSGTATGGNVPVLSLLTTYRAGDPVVYSDASSINTHAIVKMQWTFGAPGSGLCDFGSLVTLKNRINSSLLDVPGQISTAVANLVNSSPSTLDTLKELADALGDDPNFATTVATSISGKVSKTGDTMSGTLEVDGGIRTQNSGPYFKEVKIDIGDWNMDTTASIILTLTGINTTKIRSISVGIRADASGPILPSAFYQLPFFDGSNLLQASFSAASISGSDTLLTLRRTAAGAFDSTDFDDTSYNRGWIIIKYEA